MQQRYQDAVWQEQGPAVALESAVPPSARPAANLFPDPLLTANVYCRGRLDAVLFGAVAPFWREARAADRRQSFHLWVMRYARGGEHLKIRLHGAASRREAWRRQLDARISSCLDALRRLDGAGVQEVRQPAARPPMLAAPPIDAEDADNHHPDLSLAWTTYRRSPLALGDRPFLDDDHYAGLMGRCLAAGCGGVLALPVGADGVMPRSLRQRTLLQALLSGLAALGLAGRRRAEYLAYHRGWLVRAALPRDQRSVGAASERVCRLFDDQAARMAGSLAPLLQALHEVPSGGPARDDGEAAWRQSLADLQAYVLPLCGAPGYRLDPFATEPVFAPIFKVFHGLANQLGLAWLDEAFVHHLLLTAAPSMPAAAENPA